MYLCIEKEGFIGRKIGRIDKIEKSTHKYIERY